MLNNKRPFKPSIKFEPFISINKQNEVKKILKTWFFKKLSKKINFDESISKSRKNTDNKTIIIWKINLFLAEDNIFRSENRPKRISQNSNWINEKVGG